MRASSSFTFLSHRGFRATWAALAAGSLAALAVLGACSDAPTSRIAGPKISEPRLGQVGSNAHNVALCLDQSSTAGSYTFSVSAAAGAAYGYPQFEPKDGTDGNLNMPGVQQNTLGPWAGDKILNDISLSQKTVTLVSTGIANTAPDCVDAFVRATTTNNSGNRIWTTNPGTTYQQVVNPFATVIITPSSGATYTASCLNDEPALPQTAGCLGSSISATTIYTSANIFHGSVVTYVATREELPCPVGKLETFIANGSNEAGFPAGNSGDLLIKYDQFPAPNDNSYGVNAINWPGGHTFGNLTGSDKAGIQIRNSSGVIKLSFEMDYLSAKTGTPSGYASLGVTGGDGDMVVGTATGISVTTSLANNLNNTGYCVAGNCTVAGTNLLVNSPPTDPAHQTYVFANPGAHGLWDFHNTYYARISLSNPALAGFDPATWVVEANLTALHNSPDKPCPAGPFSCADITIGNKTVGGKEVKVDVNNISTTQDAFVTGVHITWPTGTNGALKSVKIGGDVIWTGTITGGTADLLLADLVADANKRKIGKNHDEDLKFIFEHDASKDLSLYLASLDFGDTCNKPILP